MEDMASKITSLLSDPDGMQKIKSVAEALFSGNDTPILDGKNQKDNKTSREETNSEHSQSPFGFSLPDGIDPIKIMSIISAFQNLKTDNRASLLLALKPHLSDERCRRVDKAVNLLKIAALVPVLKEQGLFDII